MSLINKETCYACGRSRNSVAGEDIYFHPIPSSPDMQEITNQWLAFVNLPPTSKWSLDIWKEITLCSRHFSKEMYIPEPDLCAAVPTLHRSVGPGSLGTFSPLELPQIFNKGGPSGCQVEEVQPSEVGTIEEGHLSANPMVLPSMRTSDKLMRRVISKIVSRARKINFKSKLEIINKGIAPRKNKTDKRVYQRIWVNLARRREALFTSQSSGGSKQGGAAYYLTSELCRARRENSAKLFARWFSNYFKASAIVNHEVDTETYQLMRRMTALPSSFTLNCICRSLPLSTGISKAVLNCIRKRLSSKSKIEKICILAFDKMDLVRHLDYDSTVDHILGYEDIAGNRHPRFADHALIFMVRGLMSNWKHPVAVHLGQASHHGALEHAVVQTVVALQGVGLKVVAIVSDMVQSNVSAFPSVATKTMPEGDVSTIEIGNELIFVLADPPHLLKVLRNYFLDYDVQFKGEGDKIKVAKFNIFKELLADEKKKRLSDIYPDLLSERHLNPNSKDKLDVLLAARLLSVTLATELRIKLAHSTGNKSAEDLAEFLEVVGRLFYSFSALATKGDKPLRCCVTGNSVHHDYWNAWRERLADWKFVVRSPNDKEPQTKCFQVWQKNIATVQSLWRKVRDLGMTQLKTRYLNQDPLDKFLGRVRQQGDPTSRHFMDNFKIFTVKSFAGPINNRVNSDEVHVPLVTSLLDSKFHSRGDLESLATTSGVGCVSSSFVSSCSVSKDVEEHTGWIGQLRNETSEGVVGFSSDLLTCFVRKPSNYLLLSSCFQCFKSVYVCNHSSPSLGKATCGSCSTLNPSLSATMFNIFILILNNLREIGHEPCLSEKLNARVRDVPLPELSCSEHRSQLKERILAFVIESGIFKFCYNVNLSLNKSAGETKPCE